MNNKDELYPLQWNRRKESLITTLVGTIPLSPGFTLRKLLYPTIFKRMGSSVYIQPGVEFIRACCIEIGNKIGIGRGVRLQSHCLNSRICIKDWTGIDRGVDISVRGGGYIEIGERTHIGCYVCLAGGDIKIGQDCLIASHSGIYATNHNFADPTRIIRDQGSTRKGIVIENDCWLGHGVIVLDGVTIGQGSVIGAGAVVTRNILPYSIAVGIPAKVIDQRKCKSETLAKFEV